MRLLLVEDTALSARILMRQLEVLGLERVDHVSTAEQARRMVRAGHYDLVLMDWMLPGMSGIELLRKLRQERYAQDLPIIVVTGRQQREDVLTALEAGATDYITKPPALEVLRSKIGSVLREAAEMFAEREAAAAPQETAPIP
jgi:two-component system phosphate regulon response regulator PhoB